MDEAKLFCSLKPDKRGAALVEFALALPLLALLVFGILGYGQYFLIAHEVQQAANDAARASIGGLNAAERAAMARASVALSVEKGPLASAPTAVAVSENATTLAVTVRHDARSLVLATTGLLPAPDRIVERRAVVRLGGVS